METVPDYQTETAKELGNDVEDMETETDRSCFTHVSFDNSNDTFNPQNSEIVQTTENGNDSTHLCAGEQEAGYSLGYISIPSVVLVESIPLHETHWHTGPLPRCCK